MLPWRGSTEAEGWGMGGVEDENRPMTKVSYSERGGMHCDVLLWSMTI